IVASLVIGLFLVLAVGFGVSTALWRQAEEAASRLDQERKQALELQMELARSYFESIGRLTDLGSHGEAVKAGEKGRAILEKLVEVYPTSLEYETFLASTCYMLGNAYWRNGQYKAARERYQQYCAIWERRVEENPGNSQHQIKLAAGYQQLGEAQRADGQQQSTLRSYEQSLTILEK